jgi:hypothetical protein
MFAQDDIRVNSRLSVELGLRWEYQKQPTDANNDLVTFFPLSKSFQPGDALLLTSLPNAANDALCSNPFFVSATGKCLIMSSAQRTQEGFNAGQVSEASYGPGHGAFLPRVGLSWRPSNSDKLIVHAGGGIFLNTVLTNTEGSFVDNSPLVETNPTYSPAFGSPPPLTSGAPTTTKTMFLNATAAQSLSQVTGDYMPSPFFHAPTVYEWSLSTQSQLTGNMALEVGYVGNRGVHLNTLLYNGNQPVPGVGPIQPRRPWPDFGVVQYDTYDGFSNYNALQVKLEVKQSHGFSGRIAYTYSKSLDLQGGDSDFVTFNQNDNNLRSDYGVSDFNVPHRLVLSPVYQLPFGRGRQFLNQSGVANAIAGGWDVAAIITYQSGYPFTVSTGQDFSNTGSNSPRPDRVCSGIGPQTVNEWFNVNCFSTTALAAALANGTPRFGDSGRNILEGPKLSETDVSFIKRFRVGERIQPEFRAEFFNLFNHPNFGAPNATIGSSLAGHITSAGSPRDVQLALKVSF